MKSNFRLLAVIIALTMCLGMFLAACGDSTTPTTSNPPASTAPSADNSKVADVAPSNVTNLNLWSFTVEVPDFATAFIAKKNPSYTITPTVIATDNGGYTSALDAALAAGGADAPDIFTGEGAFMKKYAEGSYSIPLKDLGIDVDAESKAAGIAQYTIDAAKDANGNYKGLAFQGTGGAFIYRRSIAKQYLGSDDPAVVHEAIKDWDAFTATARKLKADSAGKVVMVSGAGDIWHPMENSRSGQWVQDGKLVLDDNIMKYFEICKTFKSEGLWNDTTDWTEGWYADFGGTNPAQAFGFFGPCWLLRYVMLDRVGGTAAGEGTYGDWAVCEPTVPFYWGGTWLMGNKDTKAKAEVADFIRFVCLEVDGNMAEFVKAGDTVASTVILNAADGSTTLTGQLCGGQNIFEVFGPACAEVDIRTMGPYDETINSIFREEVSAYAEGSKDLDTAIADFKTGVAEVIDVKVD